MKLRDSIFVIVLLLSSCDSPQKRTRMNETDNILAKQIAGNKTPSVQYLIFDKDTVIHKFQGGLADVENQKTINWNTTFNAFSVTKTFTALAMLQLAEKGKLDIDESARQYLSDFPYSSNITIRQLLAHTSGIPNPNPLSWIHLEAEHHDFDRNVFFNQVFKKNSKTKSEPNEKFSYSNLEYILLGQIIERVSEQTYEDYIRDNILKPLDIGPEELDFEIFNKNQHAIGYQKRFSLMNGILGFFIDKSKYMDKAEGNWKPFKSYYVNGASYGGLIGKPDAFVKYIQELLKTNSQVISDEYKEMLFSENFTNSKKPTGMCLSWFRGDLNGHEYFAHAGGGGGYYCEIRIYPDLSLGSIIMFNRSGMTDERFLDKLDKYYISEK
jgi:D-alanyl-D-alanine carboxypeptidase